MDMKHYRFFVPGEDKRQMYLAKMLQKNGHEVVRKEDEAGGCNAILLPVPSTANELNKIHSQLKMGQIVYGCNFPAQLQKECEGRGIRFIDYMKEEGVANRNAVPTAEGAIASALQLGKTCIQDSKALVIGYGICGAVLADKLLEWKAKVSVVDRKEVKRQCAKSYGCEAISFEQLDDRIGKYDWIFNTVPALVLEKKQLEHVKNDVVVIDIASSPGGVDFDYCRTKNINAKLCLGLPGKYAPKSSAGILMEVIKKTMLGDMRNGQEE